jgi:GNAT superfamily N-acetyltransferase
MEHPLGNITIASAATLSESQRLDVAEILYHSFAEFYDIFTTSNEALFSNMAAQMIALGTELGCTHIIQSGDRLVGAFSWYPAKENSQRQMASLKRLLTISGLSRNIAERMRAFARSIPANGLDGAYLARIAVRADARKQGIGSLMMAEFEAQAESSGFTSVCLHMRQDNEVALRFYARLGFTPICPPGVRYCILAKNLS